MEAHGGGTCAGCNLALRSVAACHDELDVLEAQRREMNEAVVALLEQTEQWAGETTVGSKEDSSMSEATMSEAFTGLSEATMSEAITRLAGRVGRMHGRLARLVEERELFLDGLDIAASKLQRLETAVSACRGEPEASRTVLRQSRMDRAGLRQWMDRAGSFWGAEGGGEVPRVEGAPAADRRHGVGALATVWIALRQKEAECEVLARLLRKMEAAWHREESELAKQREEERSEIKAMFEERDMQMNVFKVFKCSDFCFSVKHFANLPFMNTGTIEILSDHARGLQYPLRADQRRR